MKSKILSENKESKLYPGPGSYTPYMDSVIKRDPRFKMPLALRGDVNESRLSKESVAPGAYNPDNLFTKKKDP